MTRGLRLRAHALLAVLFVASSALAQGDPVARAQSLFEAGRALMAEGRHAEACPMLEESQRLDPGGGTLLNLAACHAAIGRHATAWAEYKEALGIARRDGREDRALEAAARIAELEPRLSRLKISVSPENPPELVVKQNGVVVGRPSWGIAAPEDPGSYQISAEAPGKQRWETSVELKPDAALAEVSVPRLADLPAERKPPPPIAPPSVAQPDAPPASASSAGPPPLAWVAFGVGAVGLGVGTVFGIRALDQKEQSDAICDQTECPQTEAVELNDAAIRSAWISNIGFVLGVAGAATGAVLWITDGRAAPGPRVGVSAAPGGLRVRVVF